MERTLIDGSFEETILVPEKLQDAVPDKEAVSLWGIIIDENMTYIT